MSDIAPAIGYAIIAIMYIYCAVYAVQAFRRGDLDGDEEWLANN